MSDFFVNVKYKNKELQTLDEKSFEFVQYTKMLQLELMRIIMDVEDLIYVLQDGKPKEDWDESTRVKFKTIRHKLLDQANAIERLPNTLHYKGIPCKNLSEVVADILNKQ